MKKFVVRLTSSGKTPEEVLEAFKSKTKKLRGKQKAFDTQWLHSLLIKEHTYEWTLESDVKEHALFISNVDIEE